MVGLQERVGSLQDENARLLDEVGGLRQQNADLSSAKWAMEQEVRLAGAQRSAKRQRKVVMLGAMGTAWLGCTHAPELPPSPPPGPPGKLEC